MSRTTIRSRLANKFEILFDYYRTFSEDYKKIREYNSKLNEKLLSLESNQASVYNEIKKFVSHQQSILNQPIAATDKAEVNDITYSQIIADNSEIDRLSKQLVADPKNQALLDQLLKMIAAQNRKIILLDRSLSDHKKYLTTQVKRFSFSIGEQFPLVVFNEGDQAKQDERRNSSMADGHSSSSKNVNIFGVDANKEDTLKVSEFHSDYPDESPRGLKPNLDSNQHGTPNNIDIAIKNSLSKGTDGNHELLNSKSGRQADEKSALSSSKHMSLRASRGMANSQTNINSQLQKDKLITDGIYTSTDNRDNRKSSNLIETEISGSEVRKKIESENEKALRDSGLEQKHQAIHYSNFSLENNFNPESVPEPIAPNQKRQTESSLFGEDMDNFRGPQTPQGSSRKQFETRGLAIQDKTSSEQTNAKKTLIETTTVHQTNSTANTNTLIINKQVENHIQISANQNSLDELVKRCKELVKSNHLLSLILENRNLATSAAEKQNIELLLFIKQMQMKNGSKNFNDEDLAKRLNNEIEQLSNARNSYLLLLNQLKNRLD